MKICLIGTVASSTLNFRKNLIEILVKEGNEVFVFATDYNEKTKSSILALGASPISYQLKRGGLNPFSDIINTIKLAKKIKFINPDIVFSYFSKPVIFGSLAAKLAKVPRIIGMLEGLGYTFTPHPPTKRDSIKRKIIREIQILLYRISFKHLDRLIFLNPDDPVDLLENRKIKVKDTRILGGIGVDLDKFTYSPPTTSPIRFLFIGRLLEEKGIREYIAAARIVKSEHPTVEFVVLGTIDPENPSSLTEEELEDLIKENIITYPGHVENVKEWIDYCSIFVLPSYREGIPCSTQEAMACGRGVITTNAPGCKETVIDNKNGFLIPRFDHIALSEKMIELIKETSLILEFGKASFNIAQQKFNSKTQNHLLNSLFYENHDDHYRT